MPTPEENMQSVRTFAEEVIGNKNLKLRTTGSLTISSNIKCSCRHARQEGCNRLLSHLLRGIARHDGRHPRHGRGPAARLRSEPRTAAPTKADSSPACRLPETFEMEAMYMVRINNEGQIAEHWGVIDTIGTMGQLGLLPPQG
jgi:hypothetical protein